MKHLFLLICVLSLLVSCNSTPKKTVQETAMQPVSLILDTDLGPDYDIIDCLLGCTIENKQSIITYQ